MICLATFKDHTIVLITCYLYISAIRYFATSWAQLCIACVLQYAA